MNDILRKTGLVLFAIALTPGAITVALILDILERVRLKDIDFSGDGDLALCFICGFPVGVLIWAFIIYELVSHLRFA